jgi:GntR family transcriptional regulator / MocR family aminotransferase
MAKRASTFDLSLGRPPEDGVAAYRWLYDSMRVRILSGGLRPGARLPSTRAIASHYGLSRGTVLNAFDMLRAEGYLDASVGAGTFVSEVIPDHLLDAPATAPREWKSATNVQTLSSSGARVRHFGDDLNRAPLAFRLRTNCSDQFPVDRWMTIAGRYVRRMPHAMLSACEPMGYGPLREAVAEYLTTSRGASCSTDRIAIVSGVSEALDLMVRLTCDTTDEVCIEDPGYFGANMIFDAAGVRVTPMPVDGEGMCVPSRPARLAYVTPGHQFPTGVTMSLRRRIALLEWARSCRALIFEDDYDSEYRYRGRPIPALQGLDRDGLVVYAGTFSKVLFAGLRLGYLVVPESLVDRLNAAISITSRHSSLFNQVVLADFIVQGHFARHLRRTREVYADRLRRLIEGASTHLAGALTLPYIEAGLQLAAWLAPEFDERTVRAAAKKHDVDVLTIGMFARGRCAPGLQLSFSTIDNAEIDRGVRGLARAFDDIVARRLD